MADLPLLGVPAVSSPPQQPQQPPPPASQPAHRVLIALTALALGLLAWRGYGLSRYSTRPMELQKGVVALSPLDLNRASAAELATVPGLGETLAARIVLHRDDNGEFRSVEQLREVKGIGPKTTERVRQHLFVGTYIEASAPAPAMNAPAQTKKPPPATKIDVNRAAAAELQKLPGVGPTISSRIVEERAKRPFASPDELRRVKGIGVKTLEKLRPHVTTGEP